MSEPIQTPSTPVIIASLLDILGFVSVTVTHHEQAGDVHLPAAFDLQSGSIYSQPDFLDRDRLLMVTQNNSKVVVDAERVLRWAATRDLFSGGAPSVNFVSTVMTAAMKPSITNLCCSDDQSNRHRR